MENLELVELKQDDLLQIEGGGWIADFVSDVICGCYEMPKYSGYTSSSGIKWPQY